MESINGNMFDGAWMYFADFEWIDPLLDIMDHSHPIFWQDEYALTWLLDQKHGGPTSDEFWLEHYESPISLVLWVYSPWKTEKREMSLNTVVRDTPIPFVWQHMFGPGRSKSFYK